MSRGKGDGQGDGNGSKGLRWGRAEGWGRQQWTAWGVFKGGHAEGCGIAEGTGKGMEDGRGDCRRDEHRDQGGD